MFKRAIDNSTGVERDVHERTLNRWPEDYTILEHIEPSVTERPPTLPDTVEENEPAEQATTTSEASDHEEGGL